MGADALSHAWLLGALVFVTFKCPELVSTHLHQLLSQWIFPSLAEEACPQQRKNFHHARSAEVSAPAKNTTRAQKDNPELQAGVWHSRTRETASLHLLHQICLWCNVADGRSSLPFAASPPALGTRKHPDDGSSAKTSANCIHDHKHSHAFSHFTSRC